MGVPGHRCRWYPISHGSNGATALWACGVYWGCIKTVGQKEHDKLLRKARKDDEAKGLLFAGIDMDEPTEGLWARRD